MTKDDAIQIVEHQRKVFNLQNFSADSLAGVNPVSVVPGVINRITVPLDDPTNENSAIITYYETGVAHSNIK